MIPAANKSSVGVGTFLDMISILNSVAANPLTLIKGSTHAWYDCHAAIGTPIKFTKSLPANAIAIAKVPIMIINLYTLILNTLVIKADKPVQKTKHAATIVIVFEKTNALKSPETKLAPFNPLIKIK